MWFRMATVAILVLTVIGVGVAETPKIYSRAAPPDKAALDRLNLKMEWSLYLPVNGQRDSIESVQTFDDQIFVQTRTGQLAAIDARTGKIQWSTTLGNGGYANVYPVAVNANFVYVAHVTRLYSFYRYSGVAEFSTDLGTPPTAGLAVDNEAIYATLATRPNSAGVERIARFDIPTPIEMPDATINAAKEFDKGKRMTNPVDELGKRYPIATGTPPRNDSVLESRSSGSRREVPVGGMSGSKTPSLAVVTRMSPPYFREGGASAPSLVVMRSLRQPYRLKGETAGIMQQTPSISTIPPSVAAALALGDLRPQGIKPRLRWEYGMTHGLAFRLTMTPRAHLGRDRGPRLRRSQQTDEEGGSERQDVRANRGGPGRSRDHRLRAARRRHPARRRSCRRQPTRRHHHPLASQRRRAHESHPRRDRRCRSSPPATTPESFAFSAIPASSTGAPIALRIASSA